MYYHYNEKKHKKIQKNMIKEKVFNKIYKTLLQDIIVNLSDENLIKT